jgi:hypothetical protein
VFVKRDSDGRVVGVFTDRVADDLEEVADNDPELGRFLGSPRLARGVLSEWIESDLAMARVVEDLIDLLIDRNVISFDDLPPDSQRKILHRRGLRRDLTYVATLMAAAEKEGEEDEAGDRFL